MTFNNNSVDELNKLIRERRSVFPNMYVGRPIERETIEQILENANWAPSHKLTFPWRFKVMTGNALQRLSAHLGAYYQQHTPDALFSEMKLKKSMQKPLQSGCVIAICMEISGLVPEWEELAAVACAVQNMWLTCAALGIGSYWSTPDAVVLGGKDFFALPNNQKCLGLFYMGYCDGAELPSYRPPVMERTTWIND
jgi:nitroreductase